MTHSDEKLHLRFIWSNVKEANFQTPLNKHPYHELVYYASGGGVTHIDGRAYTFRKNDFVIIPPEVEHDEWREAETEVFCMGFTCQYALPDLIFSDHNLAVLQMLKAILRECTAQLPGYDMLITGKLYEIYAQVIRSYEHAAMQEKDFSHIIDFLAQNYCERIRLTDCAAELGVSYDYFQHRFKAITGYSPQKYLIHQRLLAAERMLLEHDDLSCTEIAYRCGFSTSAQFSALFKKKNGVQPRQYKAQCGVWTPDVVVRPEQDERE